MTRVIAARDLDQITRKSAGYWEGFSGTGAKLGRLEDGYSLGVEGQDVLRGGAGGGGGGRAGGRCRSRRGGRGSPRGGGGRGRGRAPRARCRWPPPSPGRRARA